MKLKEIQKRLDKLNEERAELLKLRQEAYGRKRVKCEHSNFTSGKSCGKSMAIKDLVYIEKWRWLPWALMGEDEYEVKGGYFVCKHCGKMNVPYNRPWLVEHRRNFKMIVKVDQDREFDRLIDFLRENDQDFTKEELEKAKCGNIG